MTTLEELRSRTALRVEGDVSVRGSPEGLHGDSWTNGQLRFVVDPARDISGFIIDGMIPEWFPPHSVIAVELDGETIVQVDAVPGDVRLECRKELRAGSPVEVRLRTSHVAYDPQNERELGIFLSAIRFDDGAAAPFICNICGSAVADLSSPLDPEGSLCGNCGSNIRLRALGALTANALFGEPLAFRDFRSTPLAGLGVSDSPIFASYLQRVLPNYTNTQFDRELTNRKVSFLDIKNPPPRFIGTADVVTCSEVLEHVEPPVQPAFDALFELLRPGGTLILTLPYTLERTVEHFPELHEWSIKRSGHQRLLLNRTRAGAVQELHDLRFHGGGNDVLEMRVFGLADITEHLRHAGFVDVQIQDTNVHRHGIVFRYSWSLPITARRPSGI